MILFTKKTWLSIKYVNKQ